MCLMSRVDGISVIGRGAFALLAGLVALLPAAGAHAQATIEGTVELPAAVVRPVVKPRYPVAASYSVGDPDPPRAVVVLEAGSSGRPPAADRKATVAQSRYQFAPGLLAVPVGTAVAFPNLDDEYHSVFSYSKPKRFDLGRYQRGEEPPVVVFDEPGIVRLFCEIHDHMRGTIVVLDTPYFTETDAEGRYRLEGLPEGRFVVRVWVEGADERSAPVELRAGARVRVDFPAGAMEARR